MDKDIVWETAMYLRVSKENKNNIHESSSIVNQRNIIQSYVDTRPDIEIVSIKIDDGFSGANYERPQFIELIKEIEQGKVNCVIVKDLSRFGRDYLKTGKYIEDYFKAKKVRFIAINDNYDSLISDENSVESELIVPMKNILNNIFLEDISVKIRTSLKSKRQKGDYVSNFAPYGYLKTRDKKLIVDEYASIYVKQIFHDKIKGYNEKAICERLNNEGILSPLEYKKSIEINYKTSFVKNEKALWSIKALKRILTNEIYIGNLVQGKRKNLDYYSKKTQNVPSEQWDRVCNTHEPIISKINFETVQELLKRDTRTSNKSDRINIFSGFLYCGDCGEQMSLTTIKNSSKSYTYYICSTQKKYKTCIYKNINVENIEKIIPLSIKNQISTVMTFEKGFSKEELLDLSNRKFTKINDKIKHLNIQKEIKEEYILKCCKDYSDSIISEDEYKILKDIFIKELNNLNSIIDNLNEEKIKLENNNRLEEILTIYKKYKDFKTIDRALIAYFVKKIIVHADYRLEIIFNYSDGINLLRDSNIQEVV